MLLIHQAGSVKIGEVVRYVCECAATHRLTLTHNSSRYTLTYTPSNDRILPTPTHLYLKIKNTSAIPLRAAYLHGPYTLHVSAYSSTFNPHKKVENPQRDGVPEFEPMLKAGGHWISKLTVPEDIRESGANLGGKRDRSQSDKPGSVTWVLEVASQILFSTSASVHFEVLVGRDERSLELGFAAVAGHGHGAPGQVHDHQRDGKRQKAQQKGVYSRAVRLMAEDTDALWDKPKLPSWDDKAASERQSVDNSRQARDEKDKQPTGKQNRKKKKVHLVVLTHGLHSNLGADMLFLKESIDATVRQARVDAKKRKEAYRERQGQQSGAQTPAGEQAEESKNEPNDTSTAPLSGGQEELHNDADDSDDDEEVIVRGFTGNAVRTENGIQYLGKRLAKYVLKFTYPDQPFLPIKKPLSRTLTDSFKSDAAKTKRDGQEAHHNSSIHHDKRQVDDLPYTFTSISFIGHSLGGLIQTYAVAYIHKHAPHFFEQIKPINFVCMASPLLGLSNENPLYVKFALDFGLVGRTGQDLGLTWRPPTLARTGWNAVVGGLGSSEKKESKQEDPAAKPLLRILPTGPAHYVLRLFRNRTVYSNVVNDGIVPLRTSCLLFLDWRGLGKVDKARRENGLIGTMAEWGWAEITGANSSSQPPHVFGNDYADDSADESNEHVRHGEGETVPQPDEDETGTDNQRLTTTLSSDGGSRKSSNIMDGGSQNSSSISDDRKASGAQDKGMFDNFLDFFRSGSPPKPPSKAPKKTLKAVKRGQTIRTGNDELPEDLARARRDSSSYMTENPTIRPDHRRPIATRGDSIVDDPSNVHAPPRTSFFEAASDILHPPIPPRAWITDPSSRARTIFHDRVYHPDDIPPPPVKRPHRLSRSFSSDSASSIRTDSQHGSGSTDSGSMKVEEKIARAYHRDLSWRKVLVRLEPDAHNNMIVRRMFANAYGWPVVKHLCDTHFADTFTATTRDEDEPARERARPMDEPMPETGEEVEGQVDKQAPERSLSESREAKDELSDLDKTRNAMGSMDSRMRFDRQSSAVWDDRYFEGSDEEDEDGDEDDDRRNAVERFLHPKPHKVDDHRESQRSPTSPVDGHRGLGPTMTQISPTSPSSAKSSATVKPTFNSSMVDPELPGHLVAEPEPLDAAKDKQSPGSVAEMGLRKSIEEQVSPTKSKAGKRRSSQGVDS